MSEGNRKRIFISALESSAEVHCAGLIRAVKQQIGASAAGWPGGEDGNSGESGADLAVDWVGFGGAVMAEAGCELIAETVGRAAMIYNVLGQLGYYRTLLRNASAYLDENKVDLVVVCDSPAFNFHIAKAAKKRGIPVLFYVAPQLWAWAPWRIHKLRRCCDRLACILPFEEEWFAARGVKAEFVGNPLFDGLACAADECAKSYSQYDLQRPVVALLPGSRQAEIESLWPVMQATAAGIARDRKGARFLAAAPDERRLEMLKERQVMDLPITYSIGDVFGVSRRSDLALVASGSATLQVAAAGCPMVVLYQSSRLMWHLVGRWLIRTRYLSLVNILARQELVPEYMPFLPATEVIIGRCNSLLSNKMGLIRTSRSLVDLVRPLAGGTAAEKVAAMVVSMLR